MDSKKGVFLDRASKIQAALNEIRPSCSSAVSNLNKSLPIRQKEISSDLLDDFFDDSDLDKDYVPASEDEDSTSDEELLQNNAKKSCTLSSSNGLTLVNTDEVNRELQTRDDDEMSVTNVETDYNPGQKRKRRWRVKDQENWKRQKRRTDRDSCVPYENYKAVVQSAKSPKAVDCSKCIYKCNENFTEEERIIICKKYWAIGQYQRKKDFILLNVSSSLPSTRRPRKENALQRRDTKKYHFTKDSVKLRVCQNFFLKTLSISNRTVYDAISNKDDLGNYGGADKRGKHIPANKTSNEVISKVKKHIESFPCMEAHYVRKSSKRKYLDKNLSINKMYNLYLEQCREDGETEIASLITYRRIFCTNYNFSFFHPKKDQCVLCNKYEQNSPEGKLELDEEYKSHRRRHEEAQKEKTNDKERSKSDPTFRSVTFDLQSVLHLPSSDVSLTYYMRKLNAFNLTVYEANPPNEGYCYFWTELNGARGSCEIGSCLIKYIEQLPTNVKHITLFSDTCGGQNRNIQIAAMFLNLVQTSSHVEIIEQKFLESGHSFMEVDSMHSAIETQKRHMPIYCTNDWINVFKLARANRGRNKPPYKTFELRFDEFLDLKDLAGKLIKNRAIDENGDKVNWIKVKCFKYEKSKPNTIQYKYDYSSEYKCLNVLPRRSRKQEKTKFYKTHAITKLYKEQLAISNQKKKDLLILCKKQVIPEIFHPWYSSLPSKQKDNAERLPEPDLHDSEDENSSD